jgi:hypothetical protein
VAIMPWYCGSCHSPNSVLDLYCCSRYRLKNDLAIDEAGAPKVSRITTKNTLTKAQTRHPKNGKLGLSASTVPDEVSNRRESLEEDQLSTLGGLTPNFPGPAFSRSRGNGLDNRPLSRSDANLTESEVDPAGSGADVLESESIVSLPGWTMGSTATDGTNALAKTGIEELMELFQDDVELRNLFFTASEILTVERFSRNLTRLLKQYAQDLLKEAENKAEKEAAYFLKQQARHISRLITEACDATTQRFILPQDSSEMKSAKQFHLDPYLAGYRPKPVQELSSAGHDDDEKDGDNDEVFGIDDQITVVKIQELRRFFISGYPFQNFRNKLRDFLYPKKSSKTTASDGQKSGTRLSHEDAAVGPVTSPGRISVHAVASERNLGWVSNITRYAALRLRYALESIDRPKLIPLGSKCLVVRCVSQAISHFNLISLKKCSNAVTSHMTTM